MEDKFKNVIEDKRLNLEDLPLSVAKFIREDKELSVEQKKQAIKLVRDWSEYAKRNNVESEDLFMLRAHLEAFAETFFGDKKEIKQEELKSVEIKNIRNPDGGNIEGLLSGVTNPEILNDPKVVVYGGVARTILRAHALSMGKGSSDEFKEELPISDVDMMIVGGAGADETAKKYGSDLTGTKVIIDPTSEINRYIDTVDLTINQTVVHKGMLMYTEEALNDLSNGVIRVAGSSKPLFGRDSVRLPNGDVYLYRGGFYRALAALLRGRGKRLVVSRENLEREKDNIGRYWLVVLFVKLLKIKDPARQDRAILGWHQAAKDIGSTNTETPDEFLSELFKKFPGFSYGKAGENYGPEEQARWLIGRLVKRGNEAVTSQGVTLGLPDSYTPVDIFLREYEGDRDLTKFRKILTEYTGADN